MQCHGQAVMRSSWVRLRMPSAVLPLRATASRGVGSSVPGSCERWVMRRARSRLSKGLSSSYLIDPTKVIVLAMGERSAATRSISESLVRGQ